MNLFKISWANVRDKKLNSFLSALLLTLGIGLISILLLLNKQLDEQFRKNLKGIDLVVGAKGSPLQLILSSIYQIDAPTGNVLLSEVNRLKMNPFVKTVIPLSMGDNYKGFRIVGTSVQYPAHFEAKLGSGKLFAGAMEATIGSKVAQATGLKLGDSFTGSHGMDQEGEQHGEHQYKIVGIFETSGSVVDQLILTDLTSIWALHAHEANRPDVTAPMNEDEGDSKEEHHAHDEEAEHHAQAEKQVTSALISFRNPMGAVMLPRQINENTKMQAASPSIEINRLFELMGVGMETLRALAAIIIIIAGISVFVSLYNSLKERKYEMALMLSMGATRTRLFLMLLSEGLLLALVGFIAGIAFSRIGLWLFSNSAEKDFHYSLANFTFLPEEGYLLAGALCIGVMAAALPSLGIYRLNISRTLAED